MFAKKLPCLAVVVVLAFGLATAQAANITWDSAATMTLVDGVAAHAYAQLIPGTVVDAKYMNLTGRDDTIPGYGAGKGLPVTLGDARSITFQPFPATVVGGGNSNDGYQFTPYGGLGTGDLGFDYVIWTQSNGQFGNYENTILLSGLEIGRVYSVQLWGVNHNATYKGDEASPTFPTFASGGNDNFSVIGNFTADATTQTITVGGFLPGPSAYLVTTPVPEIDPATGGSALSFIAGVLAMIEQRRRLWLATAPTA